MACRECFNNCPEIVSDKCVKYTGPDIDFLDIEQGDQLSQLEAAIVAKLELLANGVGISLSGLTSCDAFAAAIGKNDPTLFNVVQALLTVVCTLRTDVNQLQNSASLPTSFNTACLTGITASSTRDDILQAVITKLCTIATTVTTISANYVQSSQVCGMVANCLASSGTVQENTKMPKYVALPYHGPMTVFDASGNGLASAGYDKVYVCIGQTVNGFTLPDYRGRSPIGVNSGIPTTGMDSAVDPAQPINASYSISKNTKKGTYSDTIDTTQIPPHSHGVNDPGHKHGVPHGKDRASGNNFNNFMKDDSIGFSIDTTNSVTGVTINSTGGGQPHNSTHPVIGAVMIMYVP